MNPYSDEKILDSWKKNAMQWTAAVRDGHIESRKLATNKAIVEAVLSYSPASLIDIGCGEGWLVRELSSHVTHLVGVDAIPELVDRARSGGGGDFIVASYEDIANGAVKDLFDVIICNFSLLGKESVEMLFSSISRLLNPTGVLIVQTVHPLQACADLPYSDGWREGSWTDCGPGFTDPAPWYFRTLAGWSGLFSGNALQLVELREPILPNTQLPASIIFIATPASDKRMP